MGRWKFSLHYTFDSVRSIPRASSFTGGDNDPSTPTELKALATRIAKKTYKRSSKYTHVVKVFCQHNH